MSELNMEYKVMPLMAAAALLLSSQAHAVYLPWNDWTLQADVVEGKPAVLVGIESPCKIERMQVAIDALDAKGQIAFQARVEWGAAKKQAALAGEKPAQMKKEALKSVMGVLVDAMGPGRSGAIASAKVQPIWALCEGGFQVGRAAHWSLKPEQWTAAIDRLMPQMEKEIDAAAASGKPEPMPTVANLWSTPGMNPYDPKEMAVVYAWRNASAKPLAFDSATVKFYNTPLKGSKETPRTFLSVGFKGYRLMAPSKGKDEMGTAWVQISIPNLSAEQRMEMAKSFEAHGVGIEKVYGEPGAQK